MATNKVYKLPCDYTKLEQWERRLVRLQYIEQQKNLCWFCHADLDGEPALEVVTKPVNHRLFPKGFFAHPIHLQHDHKTGMTEGAVHAYCNAVLWQYYGK